VGHDEQTIGKFILGSARQEGLSGRQVGDLFIDDGVAGVVKGGPDIPTVEFRPPAQRAGNAG